MIKITRNSNLLSRIWRESFPYELGVAVATMFVAAIAAYKFVLPPSPNLLLFGLSITFAVLVFVLTFLKLYVALRKEISKESPDDLMGCLHTLHAILLATRQEGEPDPYLRLTVHLVTKDGEEIEQLLDYVGDTRGGRTGGRRFRTVCGVTGEAITTKSFAFATRKNESYELYLKELSNQKYSEQEAKKLNSATMSWVAMPLKNDAQDVVALVYVDATERNFFTPERQLIVQGAGSGIARFIFKRYNSD